MSTRNVLAAAVLFALASSTAIAQQGPNLGQPITEKEVGAWDINAMPDGTGLPPGSGTPAQGAPIYAQKCAVCHGEGGKGGTSAALVGKPPLNTIEAPKTIANFWGYSTTVFDFIRRAMPWTQPRTLTNDEVYAITAYILAENKLIGPNDVMNAQTLPKVKMPNADNFIIRFPDKI
jgi:S-disulfanyl-L-cysteine oxidoreductase SoxD